MADMNTKRALLLGKVETTDGTDAVPAVAGPDIISLVAPFDPGNAHEFNNEARNLVRGPLTQPWRPLKPAGRTGDWTFQNHVRGSRAGGAYSASVVPEIGPILQGAGYSQTIVTTGGSETVQYQLASSGLKGVSYYYYQDGKLRKLTGAKTPSLTLSGAAGGPVVLDATVKGIYGAPTDAALPTPTAAQFGNVDPPICVGLTATIDGVTSFVVRDFSFPLTAEVATRPSIGATDGLAPHRVRGQVPTWSLTIEDELVATKDFEGMKHAGTPFAISIVVGVTQYNKVTLSTFAARIAELKTADDNGTRVLRMSGGLFGSEVHTSDAVTILFN